MHTPLPVHDSWESYSRSGSVVLALLLLAIAALLVWGASRIRTPISPARPGLIVTGLLIPIWLISIAMVVVAAYAYGEQLREAHLLFHAPKVKVGTFLYAAITFVVIIYLTRRFGWRTALAGGILGAAAAPMLFELPFDLIVIGKIDPAIPPNPALYRELVFFPLFIVELSTIALLLLVPSMRITRSAVYALAAMFVVFAVWGAFGFGYPDALLPKSLNVASKILCFVAATLLFVPGGRSSTR